MAEDVDTGRPETNDYPDYPNPRKTLIPLENNPETFSHLSHSLGLPPTLTFHDVFSLSEPTLLALIPRPVHALLFICPAPVYHQVRTSDIPSQSPYTLTGSAEPVMWYKQTMGHTCGLMALLHAVSTGHLRTLVPSGGELDNLIKAAEPLEWRERADLLYNSAFLERCHMSAAVVGDTVAPDSRDPNGYHYICFVKGKDGHLWELEGGWDGPIDRGLLEDGEGDMLSERALDLGVRRMLEKADGNMEFSLVAVVDEGA